MIIVIDGANGTGTSTQCKLLKEKLQMAGKDVTLTSHPGSTELGQELRKLLKFGHISTTPQQDLLLFAADAMAFHQEYVDNMGKGEYLICDRFNLVGFYTYQQAMGASRGHIWAVFQALKEMGVGWQKFNRLFILDAPYEVLAKRIEHPDLVEQDKKHGNKKDRYESRGDDFMQSVCRHYHSVAQEYFEVNLMFEKTIGIDATQPIDIIHDEILANL